MNLWVSFEFVDGLMRTRFMTGRLFLEDCFGKGFKRMKENRRLNAYD